VRDRLVLGCRDSAARTRLFREKDFTLKKAIESLSISETTSKQLKKIEREDNQEPVNYAQREDAKKQNVPKSVGRRRRESGSQLKQGGKCKYCGGAHERDKYKCPAFVKSSRKCGKANNFQSVRMQKQAGADSDRCQRCECIGQN
jgi:DNA-binding transcriptional MerR regulator